MFFIIWMNLIRQWWPLNYCKIESEYKYFIVKNISCFEVCKLLNKKSVMRPFLTILRFFHLGGLVIRREKSHRFDFSLCFGWGDVCMNSYVINCLLIFFSSVAWEKNSRVWANISIYHGKGKHYSLSRIYSWSRKCLNFWFSLRIVLLYFHIGLLFAAWRSKVTA